MQRIFISIASFRDPECQHTVVDAFAKAAEPGRIWAGICWQTDREEDRDCFLLPLPPQVRQLHYSVQESQGSCWARAQALSLWREEEFILQVDSHMRFAPGWDALLLDTLARCPTSPAVLATMPPNYEPPDKLQFVGDDVPLTYVDRLGGPEELQPVHLIGYFRKRENLGCVGPILSAFIVGNFLFAPAATFQGVPFDPLIFFKGQELVYSARLWTHGHDIYQPDGVVLYHYWASPSRPAPAGMAHYKSVSPRALIARERVRHLLELEPARSAEALIDIGKYGMGSRRSLADYWRFSGIDLKTHTVEEKARRARWVKLGPS